MSLGKNMVHAKVKKNSLIASSRDPRDEKWKPEYCYYQTKFNFDSPQSAPPEIIQKHQELSNMYPPTEDGRMYMIIS